MLLLVDVGNTNITAVLSDGGILSNRENIPTPKNGTKEEFADLFRNYLNSYNIEEKEITDCVLSCTAPYIKEGLQRGLEMLMGHPIFNIGPGIRTDLKIGLEKPDEMGADLLLEIVYGFAHAAPPFIVISAGSATTILIVDKDGIMRGGMILPGMQSALEGLLQRTTHLPKVPMTLPPHLIDPMGTTEGCLQSGVVYGHISAVDGMIDRIQKEMGYTSTLFLCGGNGEPIAKASTHDFNYAPDMLFEAMEILYHYNKK